MSDTYQSLVGDKPGRVGSGDPEVTLRIGESATMNDVKVRFQKVVEDWRCPLGADCLVEGPAAVKLVATPRGGTAVTFELTLLNGEPDLATQTLAGHRFTLLGLAPYPDSTVRVDPKKYTIRLRVARE